MSKTILPNLSAVTVAVTLGEPRVLCVLEDDFSGASRIPSGILHADSDDTLEMSMRSWVQRETGVEVGYVEQLYTFGDAQRSRDLDHRLLTITYLALLREAATLTGATWLAIYDFLPWEDHRGPSPAADKLLRDAVQQRVCGDEELLQRANFLFGWEGRTWDPIRALERYEFLYECSLVSEFFQDEKQAPTKDLPASRSMLFDHRRILATALSRLRGKLTYRPVVFEAMAPEFTLTQLQETVEALSGVQLHKQNFRRLIDKGNLVVPVGKKSIRTSGRPAALYRFHQEVVAERPRPGVLTPR
ncbi:MAG: hypothetical protein GY822_03005 [Deltaproteobacteria bacterium]|nr:hypothetical protein [Deltaproteobacteria bacterium]